MMRKCSVREIENNYSVSHGIGAKLTSAAEFFDAEDLAKQYGGITEYAIFKITDFSYCLRFFTIFCLDKKFSPYFPFHNVGRSGSWVRLPLWPSRRDLGQVLYSFIHYGDLYSAPSRLLLRSAPDPCTTKKKSFETRVECVRKNPGEQSLRQRKPIPHRGTNHRECTGLGCGCTSKRNKE